METITFETISIEDADALVIEHQGWAESIARSVARAWNMDWQLDGLDGAAMEALLFCARRFQPGRGVPFKGYARKRIHEAASDAARKSKSWQRGIGAANPEDQRARDISSELLHVFPELRGGEMPTDEEGGMDARGAIRQLLIGASLVAAKQGMATALPDENLDYKRMIEAIAAMDSVHQHLVWRVYWEGISLRTLASEWETDGLNVIREHKTVIEYLHKQLSLGKQNLTIPKVRPGLRDKAKDFKEQKDTGPFSMLMERFKR